MTIKVLNEFLPNAEIQRVGAVKVGDTLEITQDEGVLNVDPASVVSAYYSNIVTEIPQDIKLELNDGTLTLKAGSKVYIPNGANKFDRVTVENDITIPTSAAAVRQATIFYRNGSFQRMDTEYCYSGITAPALTSSTLAVWYDTANNVIKYTDDGGVNWRQDKISLPIAIVQETIESFTSIYQVFNGAGYIGHHAFILPGLRGVAPDGLGDKGYVKSVNIEVNNVLVYDLTSGSVTDFDNSFLFLNPLLEVACQRYITVDRAKELIRTTGLIQYAYQENKDYAWNGTAYINPINLPVVECSLKNSAVTYFRILQPLRMATVADIKESADSFLFDYKWADHNPNKLSWLRADTFNWQDGATYKSAYKHLVEDFNGTTSATETIGSNTITYYLATDKHKIVLPDQESIVQAIYNETGVAWYYILDTANTRFKLPRTKFGFVGIRDGVGNYVPESVPNITGHSCLKQNDNDGNPTGAFYRANSNAYTGFNSGAGHFIDFDASRSSSAYQNNAPVQQRATQMYLYCYVGRANQDALEKSEIDIIAFTNNSINQLTSAKNTSLSAINTATEEGINRLNTDSNALNRTQITNCITEIPQDIKLELNDGTLTLKAGSTYYKCDGSFTKASTSQDYSITHTTNGTRLVFFTGSDFDLPLTQDNNSGASEPTTGNKWFNTTNNILYSGSSGNWQQRTNYSLPLAIITVSNGAITSIDQVFNGFSYIGSTVFALPGVKGLISDGRNADGTLKNIEFTLTSVKTNTRTDDRANTLVLSGNDVSQQIFPTSWNYDEEKNIVYNVSMNAQRNYCVVGQVLSESTKITSFQPKTTFRAVDYNDFSTKQNIATAVNYDNITNCITEIPQDIKLELNNGTLTLKAGSKVYIPNGKNTDGSNKFDEFVFSADQTYNAVDNGVFFVGIGSNKALCRFNYKSVSGSTEPENKEGLVAWYDTTSNIIKRYISGAWDYPHSLPLAIITVSNGAISSIDQVFNGFGYIGSTAFVLPGVKGLIPNGRNDDGTLKNIEFTVTKVLTRTETTNRAKGFVIDYNTFLNYDSGTWWSYDEEKNIYVHEDDEYSFTHIATCDSASNGTISNWQPKTAFHAVDYNDFKRLDDEAVKVNGNQEINDVKTFNSTLQLKNNLSFRSYGSNDSGRLQFRAQPSDNIIRGTFAITDAYEGYDGWVSQMVARSGDLSTDGFNTLRVSEKGVEYIKEEPNGNIISNHKLLDTSTLTNCITEIPQDIKLTLNNGTLTLKAGSKIYVPNGAGKFDEVVIESDVSTTRTDSQDCIAWYNTNTGTMQLFPTVLFYSGSTAPSGQQFMFWYDTTNNKCKVTGDSGSVWVEGKSFPLCLASTDGTKISAIKQVFNGFGYVGSTVFGLPGVKGLIPNGRNADGTLKNTPFTISSVITSNLNSNYEDVYIRDISFGWSYEYDEDKNVVYLASDKNQLRGYAYLGKYKIVGGKISYFNPRTAFRAVDYNDAVLKYGDQDIGGNKNFTGALTRNGQEVVLQNGRILRIKDTTNNSTTTPTTGTNSGIVFYGNDGVQTGEVIQEFRTDGTVDVRLGTRRQIDGVWKYSFLEATILNNGEVKTKAITPSSTTANDNQIATTAWVNTRLGSSYANTNASNFTATGKSTIVNWGMPDYSRSFTISSGYTTTTDGYFEGVCNSQGNYKITIGGVVMVDRGYSNTQVGFPFAIAVPKGTNITFASIQIPKFIPCKGV